MLSASSLMELDERLKRVNVDVAWRLEPMRTLFISCISRLFGASSGSRRRAGE